VATVNEQGQRVWPTLNELAKKYRISYSTLWKRRISERWDDLKEQNRITIEQESNKKYIGKVADEVERARAMLVISAVIDTSEPRTGDRGRLCFCRARPELLGIPPVGKILNSPPSAWEPARVQGLLYSS
jgi:hypothetical protein